MATGSRKTKRSSKNKSSGSSTRQGRAGKKPVKAQAAKVRKVAKKATPVDGDTNLIRRISRRLTKVRELPHMSSGDTVAVYVKVKEGEKERIQAYQGVVIKVQGSGLGRSFTVRKISNGVGVERTFPLVSPVIDRVEVISKGQVRRSRLFFLRGLKGRSARVDSSLVYEEGSTEDVTTEASQVSETAPTTSEQ